MPVLQGYGCTDWLVSPPHIVARFFILPRRRPSFRDGVMLLQARRLLGPKAECYSRADPTVPARFNHPSPRPNPFDLWDFWKAWWNADSGEEEKGGRGWSGKFSERVCRGSCMYICIFCTWALPVPCAVLVSMIGQQVPGVVCAWETLHGFAFAYLCMLNVCLCNCRHVALSSIEFLPYRDTGLAFYNHKIF